MSEVQIVTVDDTTGTTILSTTGQGPRGPVGMYWRGPWDPGTEYSDRSIVSHLGSGWISDGVAPAGEEPSEASVIWQLLVRYGDVGIVWEGVWDNGTAYDERSVVTHSDKLWFATTSLAAGEEPGVNVAWEQMLAIPPHDHDETYVTGVGTRKITLGLTEPVGPTEGDRWVKFVEEAFDEGTLPAIGDAFMGGFFAGIMDTTPPGSVDSSDVRQSGVRYALVVSPKSSEAVGLQGATNAPHSQTRWDGLSVAENGGAGAAIAHCLGLSHPSDGGSAWYLPAIEELALLYKNFKPTTSLNGVGSNTSDWLSRAYGWGEVIGSDPQYAANTSGAPAQTSVVDFQSGQPEAFEAYNYMACTRQNVGFSTIMSIDFTDGDQPQYGGNVTNTNWRVRPVRRLDLAPVISLDQEYYWNGTEWEAITPDFQPMIDALQVYIDDQLAALVDSSPAALDTLNELAAALGDDPNFATTVNAAIAARLTEAQADALYSPLGHDHSTLPALAVQGDLTVQDDLEVQGVSFETNDYTTEYTYDVNGNIETITIKDSLAATVSLTTITYDVDGNVDTMVEEVGGKQITTTMVYTSGELTSQTRAVVTL